MPILDKVRRSGSVSPGSGDYGVRVRVGNVSSVSAAALSLDWLLAAVEAAHYGHGGGSCPTSFASCCAPTNCKRKPHKKVM
jgi:hypothetical protein